MIGSLILPSLAFYSSFGGGSVGDVLFRWEQAGVFSYVLPFLLIFAIVYGILANIQIFGENKAINAIIALAVGLISLQFNFVGTFFSEIFPRVGMGLSILLAAIILIGLFSRDPKTGRPNKMFNTVMVVIGIIVAVIIVVQSYGAFGWYSGYNFGPWLTYNWPTVLGVLIFVGALIAIIASVGKDKDKSPAFQLAR